MRGMNAAATRNIAIVGAGISGLACAKALARDGHQVTLFDKGRGPGGRMSTRRFQTPLGEAIADHGAQYFTARDPRFRAEVEDWAAKGVAARWPQISEDAWIGTPTMNIVVRHMASPLNVHWNSRVEAITRQGTQWALAGSVDGDALFDAVVLAIPSEQALTFLAQHDFEMARQAMFARFQPCWTALFAFEHPLPTAENIVRDMGDIGWAARETAKPGRSGIETWVVQANASWSAEHLEDAPDAVADHLLRALAVELGLPAPVPVAQTTHRWRYAMSSGLGAGALWNPALQLGACGDWLLGPRIECAWLSGQMLADQMLAPAEVRETA